MDWWFDIDGKICRVSVDLRAFKKPSVTFSGETVGVFVERKTFKNGCTYVYAAEGEHILSINEIKSKGERYVSLYVDRTLIKEYNSAEEKFRRYYYNRSEVYDSVKSFASFCVFTALFTALAAATAVTAVAAFFNLFVNLAQALIFFGIIWVMLSVTFTGLITAVYVYRKSRMARYAIVSSLKRQKRVKAARKKVKRMNKYF